VTDGETKQIKTKQIKTSTINCQASQDAGYGRFAGPTSGQSRPYFFPSANANKTNIMTMQQHPALATKKSK
jgi:hypothetical protein